MKVSSMLLLYSIFVASFVYYNSWWFKVASIKPGLLDYNVAESVTIVSNSTSINGTVTNITTTTVSTPSLHDLQLYGVVVTILLCFIVFGGVKIINKVAPAFLIAVLFSLFCIFVGIFAAPRHNASSELFLFLMKYYFYFIWNNALYHVFIYDRTSLFLYVFVYNNGHNSLPRWNNWSEITDI